MDDGGLGTSRFAQRFENAKRSRFDGSLQSTHRPESGSTVHCGAHVRFCANAGRCTDCRSIHARQQLAQPGRQPYALGS